jgi:hypothetical protein
VSTDFFRLVATDDLSLGALGVQLPDLDSAPGRERPGQPNPDTAPCNLQVMNEDEDLGAPRKARAAGCSGPSLRARPASGNRSTDPP